MLSVAKVSYKITRQSADPPHRISFVPLQRRCLLPSLVLLREEANVAHRQIDKSAIAT